MQSAKNNKSAACPKNIFVIGTKTGKCQLCRETKKLYLLRYGFTLCDDCLTICTNILEQLQSEVTDQTSKEKINTKKQKTNFCKKTLSAKTNTNAGKKTNDTPKMGTQEV